MSETKKTKRIAVLGATGTQGSSVVKTLIGSSSSSSEWQVVGVTRNPSSERAQALQSLAPNQIQLVRADTSDVESLVRAFWDCTAVFAVTDYWAPFFDRELRAQHATGPHPGEALRRWAYDDEIRHGINIARAVDRVIAENGARLERFVWSALPSCSEGSKGKYKGIYHFDSKAKITEMIEEKYPRVAERMSVLFVGFYVANMLKSEMMKPIKQDDGTFLVQRICNGDAKHPFIITDQDTGRFVKALLDETPGKRLLGYTAMLSWAEMAQIWGKALSKEVKFRELSLKQFKELFPVEGEELLSARYSAEFGFTGGDPKVIEPKDMGIPERPEEIEEWMRNQNWSGILEGKTITAKSESKQAE